MMTGRKETHTPNIISQNWEPILQVRLLRSYKVYTTTTTLKSITLAALNLLLLTMLSLQLILSGLALTSAFTTTTFQRPTTLQTRKSSSPLMKKHTTLFMDAAISESLVHAWDAYNLALDEQPLLTKYV